MSDSFDFGGEIVWRPSTETAAQSNLADFMRRHGIRDYEELMSRSTNDVAWFTDAIMKFLDIKFWQPYSSVVDLSGGIQFPRWCVDGEMNIVHNLLDKHLGGVAGAENLAMKPALIWEGEEGGTRTLTYQELTQQTNRAANALRSLGLGKGDAIGLFMPMTPEIVIALLAIAKIGGIILPLFSGYGAGAIVSRLLDANAKALFTADGAIRHGKAVEMKSIADEAAGQVPSLKHQIVLQRTGQQVKMTPGRDHWWKDLVDSQPELAITEATSAEDVLMLIYTSGTTGKPKGAVHTHCGFPIKAAQDMAFGTDVHLGDVFYWMTDMGWMMGPWLVFGSLTLGATMLIYDGAPDHPSPDRLWGLVERHKVTQLGVSPTLIRTLIPHGEQMFRKHDLSTLKCFASTGEPWNPDPWLWLFEKVGGGTRPIINYSGGTEISGGIVMGNPLLPLKPCSFSAACPGMAADVFDEHGQSVRNQVGELVIKAPWIGMTRGFWKDPQRYLETYWGRWENTWVHGDFAAIDADGLWYILGRSDDTLKIAGKRLGPAEVESVLVHHPDVVESAAIGVPDEIKGMALVVFCVLKTPSGQNRELNPRRDQIRMELKQRIIQALGKPLAPKAILFVADLPKTRNAKVMRRMIRAAYLGLEPGDTSSLVNPEAVEEIKRAA
ncbi:MAG TPA: AMP-binding protein [Anaerolineales bacterium]|jgi:acetyl-CoA synthetase